MSSGLRNIQRAAKRETYFKGRGSKLGYTNKKAKDLVTRLNRERQRKLRDMVKLDQKMGLIP